MSKRRHSLEALLDQLADQPEPRDKAGRKRIELLANVLWRKALDGDDRDALKLLLERLPQRSYQPDDPAPSRVSVDPIHDAVVIMRELVRNGTIPEELFTMYVAKPADAVEQ